MLVLFYKNYVLFSLYFFFFRIYTNIIILFSHDVLTNFYGFFFDSYSFSRLVSSRELYSTSRGRSNIDVTKKVGGVIELGTGSRLFDQRLRQPTSMRQS